jgi:hypothetical protein
MIFCKELNKNFEDKEVMFAELLANKELIIKEKTSNILKSIDKGIAITSNQEAIHKAIETNKELNIDKDFYYFAVNSSNILDSHGDMHVKGNWDKTVKEQQKKTYLVFDHQLKRSEIIAMKEDIEMITLDIPFSLIGKNYEGNTYVLVYKVHKDKIRNKEAKELLESGYSFEASVRMQYVKIDLAMDSNLKENAKEKENFDKYYSEIANKEDFETLSYFWVIKEAKNVQESSLVMFGSNPATGLINENKEADIITSSNEEPLKDTQENKASNKVAKRKLSII